MDYILHGVCPCIKALAQIVVGNNLGGDSTSTLEVTTVDKVKELMSELSGALAATLQSAVNAHPMKFAAMQEGLPGTVSEGPAESIPIKLGVDNHSPAVPGSVANAPKEEKKSFFSFSFPFGKKKDEAKPKAKVALTPLQKMVPQRLRCGSDFFFDFFDTFSDAQQPDPVKPPFIPIADMKILADVCSVTMSNKYCLEEDPEAAALVKNVDLFFPPSRG